MNLTVHEYNQLVGYLTHQSNPNHNLHTRHDCQRKGRKVVEHLHGMKLFTTQNRIDGYMLLVGGREFKYSLNANGQATFSNLVNISVADARAYLRKRKNIVMNKVNQGFSNTHRPKYARGKPYIKRGLGVTQTSQHLLNNGICSINFINTLNQWDLGLMTGRGFATNQAQLLQCFA